MASERVLRIFNELVELHKAKDTDYSGENGSLSNFRACEAFGVPAWKGAAIRLSDKWSRFMSLMANGESAAVKDEPLEDTLKDIAVYAVIVLALREYKYDEDVSHGKSNGAMAQMVIAGHDLRESTRFYVPKGE